MMDSGNSFPLLPPDHNDVRKKAEQLAELICRTEEYEEYKEALYNLKRNEALYERFNSYRVTSLKRSLMAQDQKDDANLLRIFQTYDDVLNNPQVQTFLAAEQGVCRMLREVYDELASHVAVDLSFMEE